MPVCVKIYQPTQIIGMTDWNDRIFAITPMLGIDTSSTCVSGLLLFTQSEIDANKLSINTASDPERVADMVALFYAFLTVLVIVWGVKQLLNLFTGDTEK